jgi:hypothetical protein
MEVIEAERPDLPTLTLPMRLIEMAITKGSDVAQIKELMDLEERWAATAAKRQFVAAMTKFKATPLEIKKNKRVSFVNRQGNRTDYMHATLDNVCSKIIVGLSAVGISHKWTPEQNGNNIKVTCVLTHAAGHSETTSLAASADDSGGKNSIQAVGSTVTYLERYTLLAATGIAVKDQDDDGASSSRIKKKAETDAVYRVEPREVVEGPVERIVAGGGERDGVGATDNPPPAVAPDSRPMLDHQRRILAAKLTNAGWSGLDLKAHFGKGLNDEGWLFSDFERIQAWIATGKK